MLFARAVLFNAMQMPTGKHRSNCMSQFLRRAADVMEYHRVIIRNNIFKNKGGLIVQLKNILIHVS